MVLESVALLALENNELVLGYYGHHNLGFQSIAGRNGMILQFIEPFSGSGNDLDMSVESLSLNMIH